MSAVPAPRVPVTQGAAVPEVLITAESQSPAPRPDGRRVHLPNVDAEADAIQAAYGGAANAEVQRNISISDFVRLIAGRTTWCFPGHGDAMLQTEPTLAFVGVGDAIEVVSIDTLVDIVRPHVLTGKLKLIVLTGCCTARLAAALRDRAFVPYVVCWETVLNDEAGRIFGPAFAQAIADGAEPPVAFEKARTAVCTETEPGNLDTGLGARVQKFELDIDPKDFNLVHPVPPRGQPRTDNDGRIRRPPGAPRGRLAAGTPKLLRESTPLHDVPPLPADYMPRPEQWDLRNALVIGVRGDGTVVGIVGASPVTGIAGTAGLGKTTTAKWLAHDQCVRSFFRDGIFWLEFGKERTAMQRLVRLAELLEVPPEDLDRLERRGVDSLGDEVARRLKDRCCLIILDDVWDEEQPKPFQKLAGGRVTVMMTTRKSFIVEAFGQQLARLKLRPMEDETATRLMVQSSGKAVDQLHGPSLATLVKMCAGVPAMLRCVGRMCNTRSAEGVVKWFAHHKLCHRMPTDMARADGYQQDAAKGNLFLAYEGQLDGLVEREEELVTRCTMCAVFREDTEVPVEILSDLWGTDAAQTRGVVERLAGEHLVELVADGERIRLLDPVRDYLRCRGKSALEGWHARLLGACRARQVGGDEGSGYWVGQDGSGHFMHHLNGCNSKLGAGSLGAIEKVHLWEDTSGSLIDEHVLLHIDELMGTKPTEKIDLSGIGLGVSSAIIIACCIKENSVLKELHLRSNELGPEGGAALAEVLKCNSTLQSLDVTCSDITGDAAEILANVVLEHPTMTDFCGIPLASLREDSITELNLRGDVPAAIVLSKLLPSATAMTSLNFYNDYDHDKSPWKIPDIAEAITKLCEALKGSAVTSLTLACNELCGLNGRDNYFTITKLCEALAGSAVTTLDLAGNDFGEEGASALAAILKDTQITKLSLSENGLGSEGGAALAEGLKGNSTLQSLDLDGNSIGDKGASALAAVLKETRISVLNLQKNNIGVEGASALAAVLKDTRVSKLNISSNNIGVEGTSALAAVLKETQINTLTLCQNRLGPEGGAALAEGLNGNTTLQSLDLANNQLCGLYLLNGLDCYGIYTTEGITKLCEVLKGSAVTSLNLANNVLCNVYGFCHRTYTTDGTTEFGHRTYTTDGITELCKALRGSAISALNLEDNMIAEEDAIALAAVLTETQITC